MIRKHQTRDHTYYYDRQGRLRARTGPDGVVRWVWNGMHLVGVSDTNKPNATITSPSDTQSLRRTSA